jgi:hypothetical protein
MLHDDVLLDFPVFPVLDRGGQIHRNSGSAPRPSHAASAIPRRSAGWRPVMSHDRQNRLMTDAELFGKNTQILRRSECANRGLLLYS